MNIKLYVYWQAAEWMEGGGRFNVWESELDPKVWNDRIFVGAVDVEIPDFEVPSKEIIAGQLTESLQAQKREILAETQVKINMIDDKIRQLAALTYEVEA